MRMYISRDYKHIVMAPSKCGSSTIEQMFQTRYHWDNVYLGKEISDPANILNQYIDPIFMFNYKKVLLVRNPFDYIISGFRFMLLQNKKHNTFYFNKLTSHLLAIKKNVIKDQFWRNHCQHQPADFYNSTFVIHKLEKFDKFLNYLNKNCKKDYNLLPSYHIHRQKHIPYPEINEVDENLILELTKKAADLTGYNIPKSIENYKKKYNSGELNELFT